MKILERNISVDQVKPVSIWLQKDQDYVDQFVNNDDDTNPDENPDENPDVDPVEPEEP